MRRDHEAGSFELDGLRALSEQTCDPMADFERIKEQVMRRIENERARQMFGMSRRGLIAVGAVLFASGLVFGAGITKALGAWAGASEPDTAPAQPAPTPELGEAERSNALQPGPELLEPIGYAEEGALQSLGYVDEEEGENEVLNIGYAGDD